MSKSTLVGIVAALGFAAGFAVSEYRSLELLESVEYTDALTEANWHLRILEGLESGDSDKVRSWLQMALGTSKAQLDGYRKSNKLGSDGQAVLDAIDRRLSETSSEKPPAR